jgi:hypothetical protein
VSDGSSNLQCFFTILGLFDEQLDDVLNALSVADNLLSQGLTDLKERILEFLAHGRIS